MALLNVNNLSQTINNHNILKSVSLSIKAGNITALLGPNGAGKTTLIKTIIGLLPTLKNNNKPTINTICFKENTINTWSIGKRVANGLIYLPQQTSLFQQMSVIDNLTLVYKYHPYWQQNSWQNFKQKATQLFTQIGLTCPFHQKANSLSGGQKRKLEVLRTILMQPKVVMFDEPFAGVDPKSIYELKEIFSNMANQNIAVIVSDHNVDQLLPIAHHIYVVINGEIATSGGIKDILDDNNTRKSYFGDQFYAEISQRLFH